MPFKNKTHDVDRVTVVQRKPKQTMRTAHEREQGSHPAGLLERVVANAPSALRPSDILALQRTIGNRAVQRILGNQPHALLSQSATPAQVIQRKCEEEEPLQAKLESDQRNENRTGLPANLKGGIESLSGISMDDVMVHYDSFKPTQFQALAYTQGTDIHVGPGQEKHLAHEAWHVVQQKQGRVKQSRQEKGVSINTDQNLESEANAMGTRALQMRSKETHFSSREYPSFMTSGVVQLACNNTVCRDGMDVEADPTYQQANDCACVQVRGTVIKDCSEASCADITKLGYEGVGGAKSPLQELEGHETCGCYRRRFRGG